MTVKIDPQCYDIIGAAMQVHKILGHGFLEKVYHEALMIEFRKRHIPFEHEVGTPIIYDGVELQTKYRADFVCYGAIIVEVKAISALGKADFAQVFNYLKATNYGRGLLLNFGAPSLEYHRVKNKFFNSKNSTNSSSISFT